METQGLPAESGSAPGLMQDVLALRASVVEGAAGFLDDFGCGAGRASAPIANLAAYLALRRHDLRPLQRELMWRGLSSLGRLESRVLPTLDSVLAALSSITGAGIPFPAPTEAQFFSGEQQLEAATDALFGRPPKHRRSRIMVTLPARAATDPAYVADLVRRGMDIARVNCAHDDSAAWEAMARNVRAAAAIEDRHVAVLMDIAGPKIRTGEVRTPKKQDRLYEGDLFRLVAKGSPRVDDDVRFCASVSLPEMVHRLAAGDRVRYDDGKIEGIVQSVSDGEAVISVIRAKATGTRLKAEKGLNLPDTALGLAPLTARDKDDLTAVIAHADMIGYSFVSRPDDIDILEGALSAHPERERPLGLVAKIETPEAVRNLPGLIARAAGHRPFGVMIARGDLAAEMGFERVAEMQEEILWICEAASVPTVWATQVLENLVSTGIPSRGEMTDAAMAARAECVMLNKGPAVNAAIGLLDSLLARMDEHTHKKTPMLRALKSW